MRYRLFCKSLLLYCLLISTTVKSQLPKIYLNPKTVARENQTKFVDSIRFIPLEIKAGIKIGDNSNISVTQKYILLTDYMNKKLLVYTKDGKFVKEVDYKKFGQSFYPNYKELTNQVVFFGNNKNYSLTTKDQVRIKLDWNNPRNRKYFKKYTINLNDPSFTIKKDIPDEKDIIRMYHLYDDYYVQQQITVSPLYTDSVDHEFKLYKGSELVKGFFPYNRISEPRFLYTQENISVNKTNTAQISFVTRPYCDTIYKMVRDSLLPAYKFVLPLENTLPASFYTKPFKNKTDRDNFYRNNGWMLRQVFIYDETPGYIYFVISYLSNFDSYIYEKRTDITYKTKNIKPDSTQYNLQLLQTFGATSKGDKFYKPQKAAELLAFFEQHKSVPVPKELEEFLKSKPPANTPVIVEFEFKN